jgi:hypothetical protein
VVRFDVQSYLATPYLVCDLKGDDGGPNVTSQDKARLDQGVMTWQNINVFRGTLSPKIASCP